MDYLVSLHKTKRPHRIGRKAENLHFLIRRGFPIPATLVCPWSVHDHYLAGDKQVLQELHLALQQNLAPNQSYAVRSSADVEDGLDHSFAGQFQTRLGVRGSENVLQAIVDVWSSAHSPTVLAYLDGLGLAHTELRMAVIVQHMVEPVLSGVSFSKDPITGTDEVVVEAVQGSGEALVQEGITPQRWVHKWGTWTQQPESSDIPLDLLSEVVRATRAIAQAYDRPVDLEWVYDGQMVRWVQLREITALDVPLYSNRISREVFPGIIKPLVWSVNVPLVNGAWVRLLTELTGPNELAPERLARTFYYRAYFDMRALGDVFELLGFPREALELLMGIEAEGPDKPSFKPSPKTFSLLPRIVWAALGKLGFGRRVVALVPRMADRFHAFDKKDLAQLSEAHLLDEIDKLYDLAQQTAYLNIVTPLLMLAYSRVLASQLERAGVPFDQFDLTDGLAELRDLEPSTHLERLHRRYRELEADVQARIRQSTYEEFCHLPGLEALQQEVARFLQRFGHLSDSGNDFSYVPWRENPDLILSMLAEYTPPPADARSKTRFTDLPLSGIRRLALGWVYRQARSFRLHRESVSSLYTYGYGLFRNYYLALADRMVSRGILSGREDLFYLSAAEVRELVRRGPDSAWAQRLIDERKAEIDQVRDLTPPIIIYGEDAPRLPDQRAAGLTGIATSRGQYTGPVKVLQGLQDLHKIEVGDVLVIPYSDVGWTPLFAKAGAVVAQAGGILSHSSIVAREYGIPAVVSVPGACRLADGTVVTVDGYRGEVIVHEPRAFEQREP